MIRSVRIAVTLVLVACFAQALRAAPTASPTPSDAATGKVLYLKYCTPCHKADATGSIGPSLIQDHKFAHGNDVASLTRVVTYGIPNKGCPSWKVVMSPAEIGDVVAYLRTLKTTPSPSASPRE